MIAETSVHFDRSLYNESGIVSAQEAFQDFADLTISDVETGWEVRVSTSAEADHSSAVIAAEFANFALAETIVRSR